MHYPEVGRRLRSRREPPLSAGRLALGHDGQRLDVLDVAWPSGRLLHPDEVVHTDYVYGDPVEVRRERACAHPRVRGGARDFVQDVQLSMSCGERWHDRGKAELLCGWGWSAWSELDR